MLNIVILLLASLRSPDSKFTAFYTWIYDMLSITDWMMTCLISDLVSINPRATKHITTKHAISQDPHKKPGVLPEGLLNKLRLFVEHNSYGPIHSIVINVHHGYT